MTEKYFIKEVKKFVDSEYEFAVDSIRRSEYGYETIHKLYVDGFCNRCLGVITYLDDKNTERVGSGKYHSIYHVVSEWRDKVYDMTDVLLKLNYEINGGTEL